MKKNFFKKLSFVLALAMIISVFAPAAGVFAAAKPSLNSTLKYLHLGDETSGMFDFNIRAKQSGWKYAWTSANTKVATVNAKNGITTATGVGRTTVSVKITDKNNKAVETLKATVVVRDNIAELSIRAKGNPDFNKLSVGQVYDFDRGFTTNSGSTTKTSGITRWTVSDEENATIEDNTGIFKAEKAGKYTITARAFQSAARYNSWLKDKDDAKWATAVKTQEVTVVASLLEVKQVNSTKFTATFDTDMSETEITKNSQVYRILNGTRVQTGTEKIKEAKLSADGKVLTVEMFAAFSTKTVYNYDFEDFKGEFTTADVKIEEIDSLKFDDFNVVVTGTGTDMLEKISALNKDGVVIFNGNDLSARGTLEFKYEGDNTKGFAGGNFAYIYDEGYTAVVNATYKYYIFDEDAKQYVAKELKASAVAKGVKDDNSVNPTSVSYAITTGAGAPDLSSSDWGTAAKTVAAGDSFYIHIKYKLNNFQSWENFRRSTDGGHSDVFTFTSSNTDRLVVQPNTNQFTAVAPGAVTIVVRRILNNDWNNPVIVGTFDVNVQPARSFATAVVDGGDLRVSNNALGGSGNVKLVLRDSMNDVIGFGSIVQDAGRDAVVVNGPVGTYTAPTVTSAGYVTDNNTQKIQLNVNANGATPGYYRFKTVVRAHNTNKDVFFNVVVLDSSNLSVSRWDVELSNGSVDTRNQGVTNVSINVFGYNSAGAKVAQLDTTEYRVEVKRRSNNSTMSDIVDSGANSYAIPVVKAGATTGTALTFYANDFYDVFAYVQGNAGSHRVGRHNDALIGAVKTLEVKDSTTQSVTNRTTVVSNSDLRAAVIAAFEFKLNNDGAYTGTISNTALNADIVEIKYSTGAGGFLTTSTTASIPAGTVYIAHVKFQVAKGDYYIVYTYNVNQGITIQ